MQLRWNFSEMMVEEELGAYINEIPGLIQEYQTAQIL